MQIAVIEPSSTNNVLTLDIKTITPVQNHIGKLFSFEMDYEIDTMMILKECMLK